MFTDYQFDQLIEFLRWREQIITEREITLKQLELEKKNVSGGGAEYNLSHAAPQEHGKYSEKEIEMNLSTGFGELVPTDIGKVAKTKLWRATKNKTELICREFNAEVRQMFPNTEKITRLKTLLHCFLWSSSISARADFWPNAKDIDYVISAKSEIESKLNGYEPEDIVNAFEFFRKHWGSIFPNSAVTLNTTLIADVLDRAFESCTKEKVLREKYSPLEAPFVQEILSIYPNLDKESVAKRIEVNKFNYVDSLRQELFSLYRKARPASIPETGNDWKMDIPSFLTTYKNEINEALRVAWQKTKDRQAEFDSKRESTSQS